jgi:magnesium chelatase subunit D
VDPSVGGVAIYGGRGTCKTVLARATHALLPPRDVVPGSWCNADPDGDPNAWESGLRESVAARARHALRATPTVVAKRALAAVASSDWLETLSDDDVAGADWPDALSDDVAIRAAMTADPAWCRETRPAPFVTVPLAVEEGMLTGTIDVDASVKAARPVFLPGCLARAHRGVLYLDDLNLLEDSLANALSVAVGGDGVNRVERENMSVTHPCRPLTIATFNPEEGDVREHVLDRFAMIISADETFSVRQRVEGTIVASRWQARSFYAPVHAVHRGRRPRVVFLFDHPSLVYDPDTPRRLSTPSDAFECHPDVALKDDWRDVADEAAEDEEDLRLSVALARATLPRVVISDAQIAYLVDRAIAGACQGHRPEIFAAKIARASAALRGSESVSSGDLNVAVALAIAPRATAPLDVSTPPPPPPTAPPPPPPSPKAGEEEEEKEGEEEEEEEETPPPPEEEEEEEREEEKQDEEIPPELVFAPDDAAAATLDPALAAMFTQSLQRKPGRAGRAKKNVVFSLERGRYVKPVFPRGGVIKRVAIDATLRAAAPRQLFRRRRLRLPPESKRVIVAKDDLRNKRMSRRAGSLTIFLVDASGSMAMNRMAAAKGAALRLISESYTKRDSVALVVARGDAAAVALPPSRSVVLARRRLAELPCGGGTPLAHGLVTAARVAINAEKTGRSGGGGGASRVRVVCLTDGGANVGLDRSQQPENERCDISEYVPSRAALREEAIDAAKRVGKAGVSLLVVDTESRFARPLEGRRGAGPGGEREESLTRTIARASGGRYYRLPMATTSGREGADALRGIASGGRAR